jgi:multiple sugar transport system permease protein
LHSTLVSPGQAIPQPARSRWRLSMSAREELAFYACIAPWAIGFLCFSLIPILASLVLSFTEYAVKTPPVFAGLLNYRTMLKLDPLFWQSLKVTFTYTFAAVPLGVIASLSLAIVLNQKIPGLTVWRTIYYVPTVVSGVAVAVLWILIFNKQFGLLNWVIYRLTGIQGPGWISNAHWVIPSFILMSLWGIGGPMVIYLAALQGVPTELYEAAQIDGAGSWRRFLSITLPMISPTVLFNGVTGLISTFQIFTTAYIMTNGGPQNASLFYGLYLYKNAFTYFKMGYASALAWVLFLIIMGCSLLVLRSSSRWVYYETGGEGL